MKSGVFLAAAALLATSEAAISRLKLTKVPLEQQLVSTILHLAESYIAC